MQTTNTTSFGSGIVQTSSSCAPCDIPSFCRSYFYTGKLLTEGDFNREQRYLIDKMRLHYVALHGWGVVCGLVVRPHPECPNRIVITDGFAVDDCGREIRVLKDYEIELPKPPLPPPEPCPPDFDDDGFPKQPPPDTQTYYVCIRYQECQEDFMSVPFDSCCNNTKQPNRVCEGFDVLVSEEAPTCLEEVRKHRHCDEDDCHKIYRSLPAECPPTGKVCCIPLALIRGYSSCEPLAEAMIDNSIRPVLPSTRMLEKLILCVMDKLPKPPPPLTHIRWFNWQHDGEYQHRDFLLRLVGTALNPLGFEIEFDRRVHPSGINSRTFQAMIVREPTEEHAGRHVEIAPARVIHYEDGLRCSLHIDPEYVRRHLHEHNFDVFITLRCAKVVDEHGMPVDGALNVAHLPRGSYDEQVVEPHTGNGTPGSLFESWIRVRHTHRQILSEGR